jgi:hypothetical protein
MAKADLYYQDTDGKIRWQCGSCGVRYSYQTHDGSSQLSLGGSAIALICKKCLPSVCNRIVLSLNYSPVNPNDVIKKGA